MDGGAKGDRTPDLMTASHALSQLSYGPIIFNHLPPVTQSFEWMTGGFVKELFEQFLQEKKYLKNCSENTLIHSRVSFKALTRYVETPTRASLQTWVIKMREAGGSTGGINSYIRGINSFLTWLHQNGHTAEHLKLKQLKQEQRVLKSFSDEDLLKMVNWKPKSFSDQRLHALLCTLVDTGCRINELLTLTRGNIDFDNLLIIVKGKGNKDRIIPISLELRKTLYKFLQRHQHNFVFATRSGNRLSYDNTRREFRRLCHRLGINGFDGSFHAFRRCFAKNYLRQGGNLFYLQQTLGHSKVETTRRYVEVETSDLQRTHLRTSILLRLK
jgi:integrase/recombinase XerD